MVVITEMSSSPNVLLPVDSARGPPKFYNQTTGIQTVRGGQQVGEGFFASVLNSFYNLIYHFWGMVFAILGFSILLSEYGTTSGPLEMILKALMNIINDVHAPVVLRSLATFLAWFFAILVRYKYLMAYVMLLSVPVLVKPSGRNFGFAVVIMALAILHYITFLQVMILALLFYLFVMLRTPAHKFFIVAAVVAVFAVGLSTDHELMNEKLKKFNLHDYDRKLTFEPQRLPEEIFEKPPPDPAHRSRRHHHGVLHLEHEVKDLREAMMAMQRDLEMLVQAVRKDAEKLPEESGQEPVTTTPSAVPDVFQRNQVKVSLQE